MRRNSSREKHSFIQFYFDDWKAATGTLPRTARSVLFEVCMYNWDKRKPLSPSTQMLMFSDLPNAAELLGALVEEGFLTADAHGNIHSPRAIREGERAYAAWEGKSRGGKTARGVEVDDSCNSDAAKMQLSSEVCSTDSDSDSDTDSEKKKDSDSEIELEVSQSMLAAVGDAWNDLARRYGLKQIVKMTAERSNRLAERIREHGGPRPLIEGIKLIPESPFLIGRVSDFRLVFDHFLKPDVLVGILEGSYEPRGGMKLPASGPPPKPDGPQSEADAAKMNERLESFGSTLRWQLIDREWLLKPNR